MKLATFTGFVSASRRRTLHPPLVLALTCGTLLATGCKAKSNGPSKPALTHHDWNQELAGGSLSAARHAMPHDHPIVPTVTSDKLDEAEAEAAEALAARAALPPPVPSVPWNNACQVNRKCSKQPAVIPTCAPGLTAAEWGQLEYDADKHLGQQISTQGSLGVTSIRPAGTQKCTPGVCCHSLAMNLVLDGRPNAVGLPGQTCSGDDSALCCTLTAGQIVIATGKVEKAPAASGLKYQLSGATFCTPAPPDADAGAMPHM